MNTAVSLVDNHWLVQEDKGEGFGIRGVKDIANFDEADKLAHSIAYNELAPVLYKIKIDLNAQEPRIVDDTERGKSLARTIESPPSRERRFFV